jgi:hypothetical protein
MRRKSGRPPRGLRSIEESSEQTDKAAHLQQPRRVHQQDVFDTPGRDRGPDHGSNTTTTAASCTKILKSSTPKQSMYLRTFTLSRVVPVPLLCVFQALPSFVIGQRAKQRHLCATGRRSPPSVCVSLSLYIARLQGLSFIIGHFLSGDGLRPAKA